MRGIHGLVLVTFGALVWIAQRWDIGGLRDLNPIMAQAICILMLYGVALLLVALLRKAHRTIASAMAEVADEERTTRTSATGRFDYQAPRA
jgi:hypothetical protein